MAWYHRHPDLPRFGYGLFQLLKNHYKTIDKSSISSSHNPWWSSTCSIMLIKPMKYQQNQNHTSPTSKLLIQALFWKPCKTNEITTFLRFSWPWIIMCHHLFSCLAPRSLQDAPRASNLPVYIGSRIRLESFIGPRSEVMVGLAGPRRVCSFASDHKVERGSLSNLS